MCRADLGGQNDPLVCAQCARRWKQHGGYLDLFPEEFAADAASGWGTRLRISTRYYDQLMANARVAASGFTADFAHFRTALEDCAGRVIDVGGGNGLVRDFLPEEVDYVSIDPDVAWLEPRWDALAGSFACLRRPLRFVRGVGEALPCRDATFDTALALFSINHAADPPRVFREVARILRPGGRFLVALEDVEPRWLDIARGDYVDWRGWRRVRLAAETAKALVADWPLEADHVPVTESQVARWTCGTFSIDERRWRGSYLMLVLRRLPVSRSRAFSRFR